MRREHLQWVVLIGIFGVVFAAAAVGGSFTGGSVGTWYPKLAKPAWTPPARVFSPAWTALYASMVVAAWLVWRRDGASVKPAAVLFAIQLVLNAGWPAVFFGLRQPGWAFAELAVLWLAIVATVAAFWRVSRPAGVLLLPYLAWCTFAGALNFAIWRMNV